MSEDNLMPWTTFPGAKPCTSGAPWHIAARHGGLIVCTRPKGHGGEHACGLPEQGVRWQQ